MCVHMCPKLENAIAAPDMDTIYEVPISYHERGFDVQVCRHFGIADAPGPDLTRWMEIVERIRNPEGEVAIAVVGKYTAVLDSYKSLAEALEHGGIANRVRVRLEWIDSEIFESEDAVHHLSGVEGILVPGGFGERGAEGKIAAARFAREHNVPYLGICFGMQMAVIEAARNLAGIGGAGSTEFGPAREPVVGLLHEWIKGDRVEQRDIGDDLGGTMRLGAYDCAVEASTLAAQIYRGAVISERHRHRYEVALEYRGKLESHGVVFSGMSPDGALPEIVEISGHPWFIGVQFHPELKSSPLNPHPLFADFIRAAVQQSRLI